MMSPQVRALLDGAGSITLFPDPSRSPGSLELHRWRMRGMAAMFALVMLSLMVTVSLVLAGAAEVLATGPYLACMALMVWLQMRRARVPAA